MYKTINKILKLIKSTITILPRISLIKTLYYSLKFKAKILIGNDTDVNIHKNSQILIDQGTLKLGLDYTLPQKTVLDIYDDGKLIINGKVSINRGTKVMIGPAAILQIGNGSYINEHSRIQCRENIEIGENCAIAWNVNLLDTDEHTIVINQEKKSKHSKIIIQDNVWIGCNSIILKGVSIGCGSIIGAGTVVTKNVPVKCLSAGNPNKNIYKDVSWM